MLNKFFLPFFIVLIGHYSYSMENSSAVEPLAFANTDELIDAIIKNDPQFENRLKQNTEEQKIEIINAKGKNNYFPLEFALVFDRVFIAQTLIEYGSHTNIIQEKWEVFVKGALNKVNIDGLNLLFKYIPEDSKEQLAKLINDDQKYIKSAVDKGNFEMVKFLFDHGLDPQIRIVWPGCKPAKGQPLGLYSWQSTREIHEYISSKLPQPVEPTSVPINVRIVRKKPAETVIPFVDIPAIKNAFSEMAADINNLIQIKFTKIEHVDDRNIIWYFGESKYRNKIFSSIFNTLKSDPNNYSISQSAQDGYHCINIFLVEKTASSIKALKDSILTSVKMYVAKEKQKEIKNEQIATADDDRYFSYESSLQNPPARSKPKHKKNTVGNANTFSKEKENYQLKKRNNKKQNKKKTVRKTAGNVTKQPEQFEKTISNHVAKKKSQEWSSYPLTNDYLDINHQTVSSIFDGQASSKESVLNFSTIEESRKINNYLSLFELYFDILKNVEYNPLSNAFSHGIMALKLNDLFNNINENNLMIIIRSLKVIKDGTSENIDEISLQQDPLFHDFLKAYDTSSLVSVDERRSELNALLSYIQLNGASISENNKAVEAILFIIGEHWARLIDIYAKFSDLDQETINLFFDIKQFRNGIKHDEKNIRKEGKISYVLGKNAPEASHELFARLLKLLKIEKE